MTHLSPIETDVAGQNSWRTSYLAPSASPATSGIDRNSLCLSGYDLFPMVQTDVITYGRHLQTLRSNPSGTRDIDDYKVQEIRLYKSKYGPQHEYIIAVVTKSIPLQTSIPSHKSISPQSVYLRLERFAQTDEKPKKSKKKLLSRSNSEVLSKIMGVKDCVRVVETLPSAKDEDLIDSVAFNHALTHRSLRLCDLAVLVGTMHDHAAFYQAMNKQCYWFAATIVKVLKTAYDYAEDIERKPYKGGTYRGIPVQKREPTDYQQVQEKFLSNLSKFQDGSFFPILITRQNQEVEELKKDAEEAKRKAEESEKIAEESKEKARELEKENEELRAQLKRLQQGDNN